MENEINSINESESESLNQINLNEKPKTKKTFKSESGLFSFLFIFSIAFLLTFYLFNIFISITPIKVVGVSMQPTINSQVINDSDDEHCDIAYYNQQDNYTNGDIIIMSNPNKKYIDSSKIEFLIKRVIACPGQTIRFIPDTTKNQTSQLINSKLYYTIEVEDKNGTIILSEEEYIKEDMFLINNHENYAKCYDNEGYLTVFGAIFLNIKRGTSAEIEIEENKYFVMGDNRNNSSDSRIFGSVDITDIDGKVELIVPYGESLFSSILKKIQNK